jgi:hypothetical protein
MDSAGFCMVWLPIFVLGKAGQDCEAVLAGLASSPACASLEDNTRKVAPQAADGSCASVQNMLKTFTAGVPAECCPALRTLVTSVTASLALLLQGCD